MALARIRWSTPARLDLIELAERIERDDQTAARRTVQRIVATVDLLARYPYLGRDGRVEGSREIAVSGTPFVIGYSLARAEVRVARILHGARNWPATL